MDVIEFTARAVHASVREYNLFTGEAPAPEWTDLSEDVQNVVRDGVRAAILGQTADLSHARWADAMRRNGWTLGPKDYAAKTHPHLVPFTELPETVRRKDHLVVTLSRSIAALFARGV